MQQAWKNYVAALAKHFSGRITHYEIWNEPDLPDFWRPGTSDPLQYAELVNLTAEIILKHCSSAKIGACMSECFPSVIEHHKNYFWDFASHVKHLDFFCYHRYATRAEVDLPQNVAFLKKIFALNGLENVELWGGECGFGSYIPKGHTTHPLGQSSQHQQAVNLLRYYVTDAAVGCRLTSFFTTMDYQQKLYQTAISDKKDCALSGILNGRVYTPKQSYWALANMMVNMIIGSFNVFIQVMMLTGGNPSGKTSTLQYLLYDKAFNQFEFGEASAIGMISAVTIVVLTVVLNRTLKLDHQEQEG